MSSRVSWNVEYETTLFCKVAMTVLETESKSIITPTIGRQNIHSCVQYIAHNEVEYQVQERLLELQALTQSDIDLLDPDREKRRPRREC